MYVQNSSNPLNPDNRLFLSLNFHLLEGVIQLYYQVIVHDQWIEVIVNTHNISCDVIKLLNETMMNERGARSSEKFFPSGISLELTPATLQSSVISISVSKSSENPSREIGIEVSSEPHSSFFRWNISDGERMTMSLKPWKFEQSVRGDSAILNWSLQDSFDGKEFSTSKPSKLSMLSPKSWFKDRYSNAYGPFTKYGGFFFFW